MFVWQVRTLLKEMQRQQPDLYAGIMRIAATWGTPAQERITAEVWAGLAESTIDHGIMEHAERVAVVPAEMGWSDVGDWHGLGELIEHDGLGNSVRGDLIQVETRRSVVWSETGRLVALVGLENVVVVDCEDALLVIDRDRSQDVRKIVGELKRLSRNEFS
jgi:mannose-1-phosphate guanylyltransferase